MPLWRSRFSIAARSAVVPLRATPSAALGPAAGITKFLYIHIGLYALADLI